MSLKTLTLMAVLSQIPFESAFGWPWDPVPAQKTKSSELQESPAVDSLKTQPKSDVQGAVSMSALKPPEAQAMRQEESLSFSKANAVPQSQPDKQPMGLSPLNDRVDIQRSYTIAAPQRNANYEKAVKLQGKLNDLLKLSGDMDRLNRSKVIAVQGMVDKARINQSILTLLASPGDVTTKLQKRDADQILPTKKLRGMREEAEKQIALAQTNKSSANPTAQKTIRV